MIRHNHSGEKQHPTDCHCWNRSAVLRQLGGQLWSPQFWLEQGTSRGSCWPAKEVDQAAQAKDRWPAKTCTAWVALGKMHNNNLDKQMQDSCRKPCHRPPDACAIALALSVRSCRILTRYWPIILILVSKAIVACSVPLIRTSRQRQDSA